VAIAGDAELRDAGLRDIVLQSRGDVSMVERGYAREKVGRLRGRAPGPVLFTRVELALDPDPACERPASATVEFDLNGHVLRARASAATTFAAVDALENQVRRRFERGTRDLAATTEGISP
jgi:hypothetical protein